MTTVEMTVNMDCHGCEKKVRRALENLDGVDSIEIEMDLQKVTVTGWAELWPFPYNSDYFGFTQQYTDLYPYHGDTATYNHSDQQPDFNYKHHVHGYNGHEHNTGHQELLNTTIHGETPFVAFSDENVNACLIM